MPGINVVRVPLPTTILATKDEDSASLGAIDVAAKGAALFRWCRRDDGTKKILSLEAEAPMHIPYFRRAKLRQRE